MVTEWPLDEIVPELRTIYRGILIEAIEDWLLLLNAHELNERAENYDPGYGFGV